MNLRTFNCNLTKINQPGLAYHSACVSIDVSSINLGAAVIVVSKVYLELGGMLAGFSLGRLVPLSYCFRV